MQTGGTISGKSTAEAGVGGFGFAFVALALGLGAAGAGIGIAIAYKPTPPTPPMIPLTSLGQTPIGAPSYTVANCLRLFPLSDAKTVQLKEP